MKKIKRIDVIAIVSIIIFAFSITPITFQNDTYYTIAIGKHILENGMHFRKKASVLSVTWRSVRRQRTWIARFSR